MTERQGLEIDYCPQCRGVWLDRGERDKIIERTSADMPPAESPRHEAYGSRQHSNDSSKHGYHKKKKGSLLKELFDF